jgi:hypothetical protein
MHVITFIVLRYASPLECPELLEPLELFGVVVVDSLDLLDSLEHSIDASVTQGKECRLMLTLVWHRFDP